MTCPGPDARADFADLVAVAGRRLRGCGASKRRSVFPRRRRARRRRGGRGQGTRTGDSDEDEMDALLRDLPGGIGA